ncbi:hypothetical protein DIPPA_30117 [Diplonema papillatum]|nr:hypothetical protein DIPPA_30117 [Diplonema papillatum]
MVNPLLPLLELQDKHVKQCRRLKSRRPADGSTDDEFPEKKRKKKRRHRKQADSPSPLCLEGRRILPGARPKSASERLPPIHLPRGFTLPLPDAALQPGAVALITRGTGGVTLAMTTYLLRHDFTPALILKLTEALQAADSNKNRALEKAELLGFMTQLYLATGTTLPSEQDLRKEVEHAFQVYDKDDNERLDLFEVVGFLRVSQLMEVMKKKWRPRVGNEALILQKEVELQKQQQSRVDAAKRHKWEAKLNDSVRRAAGSLEDDQAQGRVLVSVQEEMAFHRTHTTHLECCGRWRQLSTFADERLALLAQYALQNRRQHISAFVGELQAIKQSFTKASMDLVRTCLAATLRNGGGGVSREVQVLFNAVGFDCSLNKVIQQIAETTEAGRDEEILSVLESFATETFSADKWSTVLESFGGPREVEALVVRLEEYYDAKFPQNLNVLGEISDNLGVGMGDLLQLSSTLYRKHAKKYPNNSPSALLVMCLYTCESEHIGKLLRLATGSVESIYKSVNWALREGSESGNAEAHVILQKWIGFISVLSTTKVNSNTVWRERTLYRGLMNLPRPVFDDYISREPGEVMYWPAATSASLSKNLVVTEFTKEGVFFTIDHELCSRTIPVSEHLNSVVQGELAQETGRCPSSIRKASSGVGRS